MHGLEGIAVYFPPVPGGEVQIGASPITRVGALLRRSRLDARLAAGADPCESPTLAHRAALLTSGRGRQKVAAWLERILVAAKRPGRVSGAVAPHRAEVHTAARRLLLLRQMLRSRTPVYARGVAMLKSLLQDGAGPLYRPVWPGELDQCLALVIAALEGQEQREGPDLLDD